MFILNFGTFAACRTARYILSASSGDPFWSNVTFLSHFDTDYTDLKVGMVPSTNTTTLSAVDPKFGAGSVQYSSSNRLRYTNATAFDYGANDFTVELWLKLGSGSAYGDYVIDARSSTVTSSFYLHVHTDPNQLYAGSGAGAYGAFNHAGFDVWQHIAIVGEAGTIKFYVNGILAVQGAFNGTSNSLSLGCARIDEASDQMTGFIDEVRVTKGVARYTANFTPPTAAFPNSAVAGSVGAEVDANIELFRSSTFDTGWLTTAVYSNGNLTINNADSVSYAVTTFGISGTEKRYWEVLCNSGTYFMPGLSDKTSVPPTETYNGLGGDLGDSWGLWSANGTKYGDGVTEAPYGVGFVAGALVGVAVDMVTGAMWFSINGVWQAGATIEEIQAGITTNAFTTGLTAETYYPAFGNAGGGDNSYIINMGASAFTHTNPYA